jgi:hypothetical protein
MPEENEVRLSYISAWTYTKFNCRDFIPAHPLEVFRFAVRHRLIDLVNESALQSMGRGVAEAIEILPVDVFKAWVCF